MFVKANKIYGEEITLIYLSTYRPTETRTQSVLWMLIAVAIAEKVLGKGSKTPVTENVRDGGTLLYHISLLSGC